MIAKPLLVVLAFCSCAVAFRAPLRAGAELSRREIGARVLGGALGGAFLAAPAAQAALITNFGSKDKALPACTPGAKNCWSTANPPGKMQVGPWVWGDTKNKEEAMKDLANVINNYPQEGQSKIDGGGWKVADGSPSDGYVRVEYTSKRFKFVDDLEFRFGDSAVEVRSSSREGDYDFEVNKTRLNYFANQLKALGWNISTL